MAIARLSRIGLEAREACGDAADLYARRLTGIGRHRNRHGHASGSGNVETRRGEAPARPERDLSFDLDLGPILALPGRRERDVGAAVGFRLEEDVELPHFFRDRLEDR